MCTHTRKAESKKPLDPFLEVKNNAKLKLHIASHQRELQLASLKNTLGIILGSK